MRKPKQKRRGAVDKPAHHSGVVARRGAARRYLFRSAVTGRFVTARYAARHRLTTVRERR